MYGNKIISMSVKEKYAWPRYLKLCIGAVRNDAVTFKGNVCAYVCIIYTYVKFL